MLTQKHKELLEQVKNLQEENTYLKKQKKYGLVWEDKPEIFDKQSKNALPVLVEKSRKFSDIIFNKDGDFNILIEGDNYHSLSVLRYTHRNSIDVIYIDPPYNTGNKDFIYNDYIINKDDTFRHSKWLSFMNKRLRLAKDLLKDDGVIFISIDDNEQAQLKLLCDYIFGNENYIANLNIFSNPRGRQSSQHFAESHEYILVYGKNKNFVTIFGEKLSEEKINDYSKKDNIGYYREIGLRLRGGRSTAEESPSLHFPIYVNPKTDEIHIKKLKNYIEIIPKF